MPKKEKFIDDGRVISSMNVEGMPWYAPKAGQPAASATSAKSGENGGTAFSESGVASEQLTRGETIAFAWGVTKAALLVGLVFVGALFGFILFCVNIWFR